MIHINLIKAKNIAHEIRRVNRAKELQPLDIKATIPAQAAQAELDREAIRIKYDQMQTDIDAATSTEQLKSILSL